MAEAMAATDPAPRLVMVAAVARNGVIGAAGGLPWHLPEDLAYFRTVTLGRPMLMGRRTFESLGRVLDGRPHIVLTRRPWPAPPAGVTACPTLSAGLASAGLASAGLVATGGVICVIGGGDLFAALLDRADRLLLTDVDLAPDGDTWFPTLDAADWHDAKVGPWQASAAGGVRYRFRRLDRRPSPPARRT